MTKSKAPAGRVVSAAATMSAPLPGDRDGSVSKRVEAAMIKATEDAMAAGIVDPDEILKLKLAARQKVRDDLVAERAAQDIERREQAKETDEGD